MDVPLDTNNYASVLNSAASLFAKDQKLQQAKKDKSGLAKNKKTKKFLDSFLDANNSVELIEKNEIDYEKQLTGLKPSERKQLIEDIMADLQDKVYSSGANLADTVNPQTIKEYKNAVKMFVNFAVKHSLDIRSVSSGGYNILKQRQYPEKKYVTVKVIDEKMERLMQELLFNQLEKLAILERLDEIKGLLVDLIT